VEYRRENRRYERQVPIEVTCEGQTLHATTGNISLGGVFILAQQRFPFEARVALRMTVPTQAEPIVVGGQVRWTEHKDGEVVGFGVAFDGLRARDVWALNKLFEQPVG
jgi:Tfp pilus assembly protein PilZ